jgi:hypothetical protein
MKMISSTSITSTSGTTLISESDVVIRRPRLPRPRRRSPSAASSALVAGPRHPYSGHYVKFLSAMFRNSIEKSSIDEAKFFTRCEK